MLSDPENGFEAAEAWLTELWAPQLLGFREKIIENPQARDELNKLVLGKGVKLLTKEERPMTYDSNSVQCYHIGIYLTGWGYKDEWLGSGDGQNKVQAGVAAAADALKRNGPVLQDAVRQKNELRAARLKEQEEKENAAGGTEQQATLNPKESNGKAEVSDEQGNSEKKRKKEEDDTLHEKKKHKKEKKEKKRTAATDDDSS